MWWMLGLALSVAHAQAAPEDQAKALYEQGVRYYQQGDYDTAIRLWRKTYELTPLPALLHNIAKATEESNQPQAALQAWKEYRDVAPADGKVAADSRIAALEIVVATLAPPAPVPTSVAAKKVAPVPAPEPENAVVGGSPVPGPPHQTHSARGIGAALLGVGGTAAIVGGGLLANGAQNHASSSAVDGCASLNGQVLCDGPTRDALQSRQLDMVVGMALVGGGVAMGGGSVFLAVSGGGSAALTFQEAW